MDFDAYNGIRIVFGAIAVLFAVVGIAFWLIASMQKKWKAVFGPETASRDDAVKELFSRLVRLEEKTARTEAGAARRAAGQRGLSSPVEAQRRDNLAHRV